MSATAPSTGPSHPVDERQPLLESRTTIQKAHADAQLDPEAAVSADEPEDAQVVAKKANFRGALWYLVFATIGGVIVAGIIKSFIDNGDIEVRLVVASALLLDRPPVANTTHSLTSKKL